MTEEQKLKDIFSRRARRVHREDLKKNDLPWSNILVFFLPCEPCGAANERKAFAFRPVECPACGSGARYWFAKIGMEDDTDLERKQRSSFRATPTKAGGDPREILRNLDYL
jgi:hypothetical protein